MSETSANNTATTTQPEENGAQNDRTFTQEEVNRIVSERLSRERAKTEPTEEEKRLAAISARESKIACQEFLNSKGYPESVSRGMLEMFDTADSKQFEKNVEKLLATFPAIAEPIHNPTGRVSTGAASDALSAIFRGQNSKTR